MLLDDRLLLSDLKPCLLALNLFVVAHQLVRDDGLSNPDSDDLDAWGPLVCVTLEGLS